MSEMRQVSWLVSAVFAVPAVALSVAAFMRPHADMQRNGMVLGAFIATFIAAVAAPPVRAALGRGLRTIAAEWRPPR